MTYYFSKLEKKSKLLWNITLGALVAVLIILTLVAIIFPQLLWSNYLLVNVYVRAFCLVCLFYISIHALRSHIELSNPKTLMIPLGWILLGIGQYSSLIAAVDLSVFPLIGALVLRLAGLAVFLYVSYSTFHSSEKRE
jgi:amino acid transporter